MSKIKLSTNSQQFPRILPELPNFSWNFLKIKLPTLSFKDGSISAVGIILAGYALLILIGASGLYTFQGNTESLYQERILIIKGLDNTSELIQKTNLATKTAIDDASKSKAKSINRIDDLIASNSLKLTEINHQITKSKSAQEKELFIALSSAYTEWLSNDLKEIVLALSANNIALASQIYASSENILSILEQNTKALTRIQYEESKKESVQGKGYLYFFVFFGALLAVFSAGVIGHFTRTSNRQLDQQLGAKAEQLLEAAGQIASGNLNYPIRTQEGDHSSILAAIKAIQEEFKLFMLDTKILNKSISEGKILGRRNIDQHQGEFQKLAEELNTSIDHCLGHGLDSEKKYKEMQRMLDSQKAAVNEIQQAVQNFDLSKRIALNEGQSNNPTSLNTINLILDQTEYVLTSIRGYETSVGNIDKEITSIQEKLSNTSEEQIFAVKASLENLDGITALNKLNAKTLKAIQNRAMDASKSIQEICESISAFENKQNKISKRSKKEISFISPLENISFSSLDSGNTSIINHQERKSLTKFDLTSLAKMSADLQTVITALDGIAKDGSKIITSNAEQTLGLSDTYSSLAKIDQSIQKSSQLVEQSSITRKTLQQQLSEIGILGAQFTLTSDVEKREQEKLEAEAQLIIATDSNTVQQDTDWELF